MYIDPNSNGLSPSKKPKRNYPPEGLGSRIDRVKLLEHWKKMEEMQIQEEIKAAKISARKASIKSIMKVSKGIISSILKPLAR